MNTPGQNSNAVAELVFGLLITLIRKNILANLVLNLEVKL